MPRSIVLGNGDLLVCLDAHGFVRDFFYDRVGQENQTGGHRHHVGIWVDGSFSWLDDPAWKKTIRYQGTSMVSLMTAEHAGLGIILEFHDFVYNEKTIFVRRVVIRNQRDAARETRLFFGQEFQIAEDRTGISAFYDPTENVVIHYKGRRVFVVGGQVGRSHHGLNDFAIGTAHHRGLEGTWRDAEDGALSKNPVDHGSVDSTIGFTVKLSAKGHESLFYWVAAGHTLVEARSLHHYLLEHRPQHLLETTKDFWRAWVNMYKFDFLDLPDHVVDLFKLSLLIIRTHVDNRGAIIASADSDFLQGGMDTYAYMWPRDGAFVAKALDSAGYFENTQEFFKFCNKVIMPDGYLMHKYMPDRSLGSSWHPWGTAADPHLPIQEDETALPLHALLNHFRHKHDLEFIESIYNSFIRRAANFLGQYRDERTKLPRPSYDLWEENRAVSTFTAASVYGGLMAAAEFSRLLGKTRRTQRYLKEAAEVKAAILKYMFDEKTGAFIKSIRWSEDGREFRDATMDASSAFGILEFGVLEPNDPRLASAMEATRRALWVPGPVGGMSRYVGDRYFRAEGQKTGNPWFICTLWYAQYVIKKARTDKDLQPAREILAWTCKYAQRCGVLSEQIGPADGRQLSAAPLTWSHAAFVTTMIDYLAKLKELGICETCLPV